MARHYSVQFFVLFSCIFFSAVSHAADKKTIQYPSNLVKETFTVDAQGRPHGLYEAFYDEIDARTGKQFQKGSANFRYGKLHGSLERYYPDGRRQLLAYYEYGKLHGRYVEYDTDGTTVRVESTYEGGVLKTEKRVPK